jgi:hypothetical protein
MLGSRVTDAVEFFRQREEYRHALKLVRHRTPDPRRWRHAVGRMSFAVASLAGRVRNHVEEPLREVVMDLDDGALRREVVLDARRLHVDLDRGEVLAPKTFGDLRRAAFLTNVDIDLIRPHVPLVDDFFAPIDVAGVVVVGRSMAEAYQRRSHRLMLELPTFEQLGSLTPRQRGSAEQANRDSTAAARWGAFSRSLLDEP